MKPRNGWRMYPAMILALVLIAAGWGGSVGCVEQPASEARPVVEPSRKLTIITPHNERIRDAFETGFSNWHHENRGSHVDIRWIVRGTPECVKYVESLFSAHVDARPNRSPDLMFGGGVDDHRTLSAESLSRPVDLADELAGFPEEVAGLPTRDAEGHWFATGLSSFGIVYNDKLCRAHGIEPPKTWEDLADPRFQSWVGVADPAASGSHRQCLVLILQHQGWDDGWGTILRILANSRALVRRSSEVLSEVGSGIFLAGFAVNFDGLTLAAESDGAIRYINPIGATAATPSVTSVLQSVTELKLAEDFLRYCLSEAGQVVWSVKSSARSSYGPTLYHYPLSPQIYADYSEGLSVAENPLETDFGLHIDLDLAKRQSAILVPLVQAVCGENHVLLQRAWKAVIDAGLEADALAALTAPPFDEATAYKLGEKYQSAEPTQARAMKKEWSEMFRNRFQGVLEAAGG